MSLLLFFFLGVWLLFLVRVWILAFFWQWFFGTTLWTKIFFNLITVVYLIWIVATFCVRFFGASTLSCFFFPSFVAVFTSGSNWFVPEIRWRLSFSPSFDEWFLVLILFLRLICFGGWLAWAMCAASAVEDCFEGFFGVRKWKLSFDFSGVEINGLSTDRR